MKYLSTFLFFAVALLSLKSHSQSVENFHVQKWNGFFSSSLSITAEAGEKKHHFAVTYYENSNSGIKLCNNSSDFYIVFVIGPVNSREIVKVPTKEYCKSNGSYDGNPNNASWGMTLEENPELWEKLFSADQNGNRWYAVEVAGVEVRLNDSAEFWDSRFGQNYQFILK